MKILDLVIEKIVGYYDCKIANLNYERFVLKSKKENNLISRQIKEVQGRLDLIDQKRNNLVEILGGDYAN